MKNTFFCLLAFLIFNQTAVAQNATGQLVWSAKEVKMLTISESKITNFLTQRYLSVTNDNLTAANIGKSQKKSAKKGTIKKDIFPVSTAPLPPDFYNFKLGWVCKQEWKLEKTTSIPIRLRLGSKDQVDYLEGKNNHHP